MPYSLHWRRLALGTSTGLEQLIVQDKKEKLPAGWRIVRFGDVVHNVQVNVNPQESGLDRYVAGEHMETDNLHIKQWGVSVNAYINWKDIAWYEFPLPPKDEQRRISDILWSVDEAICQYDTVLKNLEGLMRQSLTELTTKGLGHTNNKLTVLGHIP